jgi:beta-lactamase superfamily II metal-dependent hydrolase
MTVSYQGLEIDLLNLGNADSILVTCWSNGLATRVLIDGGNSSDSQQVLAFLRRRGIAYLDHIVCSHPHDDHAAGLIGILNSNQINFGEAWLHLPRNHANFSALQWALSNTSAAKVRRIIQESLETQSKLESAIRNRNKVPREPFVGESIGFLTVCGPTRSFYEEQLAQFADVGKLAELEESLSSYQGRINREEFLQGQGAWGQIHLTTEGIGLGEAPTEPENESSTILCTVYDGKKLLLTADAGVEALIRAKDSYDLANLTWMQIPHHGSRRNINEELIAYFRPGVAYVSAEGNNKHPRRMVVNAFKSVGTRVFSTHYPGPQGGDLWYRIGVVPVRPNYGQAVALYDGS